MKKLTIKGYINGIFAAISYGTNPLFALPMYKMGMGANSVLFYRYLFAVIIYGIWLTVFKKVSLKINFKEFFCLYVMSVLFALSSVTLFESFNYIDSGVACTILFIYPIIVALICAIFFKEKISKVTILAMLITLSGIFLLNGGIQGHLNTKGLFYVLSSALVYAIYIVLVKNRKTVKHIKTDKLSFYVMFLGLSVFIFNLNFCTELQPINNPKLILCALALAIFPTIISLETINAAIRIIGATTTAVLGALEPLTAVFFGVLLFKETLRQQSVLGIALVLSGVLLVILKDKFSKSH